MLIHVGIKTTSQLIEDFIAIATACANEEVKVLICQLCIETVGEVWLDIAKHYTVKLIYYTVIVHILELWITRLNS